MDSVKFFVSDKSSEIPLSELITSRESDSTTRGIASLHQVFSMLLSPSQIVLALKALIDHLLRI